MSDIFYAFIFYFILLLFGVFGFILLKSVIKKNYVLLYLISKPFGLAVFAYPIWILSSIRILNFNPDYIVQSIFFVIITITFAYIIKVILSKRQKNQDFFYIHRMFLFKILFVEIFSLGIFLSYLYIKSFNPNIESTEKFMDLHLLMSAGKTDYFPFFDGWWAEKYVNYYYYGFYLLAVVAKIGSIPYAIAYNLSLGFIFIQTIVISAVIGFKLTRNYVTAFFSAALVALSGNLHYASCVLNNKSENLLTSCHYAKATRILDPAFTINEIPSYSFLLGDLHPHVISLPFFLLVLYILIVLYKTKKFDIYLNFIFGFVIATAGIINFWDFMTLGSLYGILIIVKFVLLLQKSNWNYQLFWKKHSKLTTSTFLTTIVLALSPFILYSPFFLHFKSPVTGIGFAPEYVAAKGLSQTESQYPSTFGFLFGIWAAHIILILISFAIIMLLRTFSIHKHIIPLTFVLISILLITFSELFFFQDLFHIVNPPYFRANTVFKLTYHSWVILGIITPVFLAFAWNSLNLIKNPVIGILSDFACLLVIALPFTLMLIYPFIGIMQVFDPVFPDKVIKNNKNLTLDGSKFIESINMGDYKAIQWLNENQKTRTVILEAAGPAYTYYGRIGVHTGMGNILNWETHQWTWRFAYPEGVKKWQDAIHIQNLDTGYAMIAHTKEQVRIAYETDYIDVTKSILEKYNVEYVYIGDLERTSYNVNEGKFYSLGEIVMKEGNSVLIKVSKN